VIPAQRGAPACRPAAPKGGEQKPILAPWMKDRAEFTGKVRDVGKRAAHTVGGTYGTLCLTPCECCGLPHAGFGGSSGNIWRWVSDAEAGRCGNTPLPRITMMITSSTQNCEPSGPVDAEPPRFRWRRTAAM
jgi:hypothetical protein